MKKYVIVGTGNRGILSFAVPLVKDFPDCAELAAVCDSNIKRARLVSEFTGADIPAYNDFDKMMNDVQPGVVIVTTKDCTHDDYIVRALELGCDVITEKPMTIDDGKCARILETERRTGHRVTVAFNYRFIPFFVRIKELIVDGAIGEVLSVHFEWLLDTSHGADYFRRWHRRRENSGSLLVHKATHHFDLVNWWLEQEPVKVNAFGTRRFYGPTRENRGERCLTCPHKDTCEFYIDINTADGGLFKKLYKDCEDVDGYYRDGCVFSDEIDIEDTMGVTVRYNKGAILTYSLTAYAPYECMKIVFNGTKGRIEANDALGKETIKVYDRRGNEIDYNHYGKALEGGHGGSDPLLRSNMFRGYTSDPLGQMAGTRAGAMSIGTGIAANKSMKEDRAVYLSEFLGNYFDMEENK